VPPEIDISCKRMTGQETDIHPLKEEPQKDYYMLLISDNGIGFDQQDADRIFTVFERLHSNQIYQGTGVGLAIVRRVIENHHGFIQAEGRPGSGSTFKIFFPASLAVSGQ
jgi:signal transduction histidine kinase